jgi:cytosine/adenosine deaminase-related metal-dependent hydrolase
MRAFHADAVITGEADVHADGAVVVGERGEIVDVGRAEDVIPRSGGAVAFERVRGALLPGLVNAHTHLELSAMRGLVPGGAGFVPWVEHLIGARVSVRPELDGESIDQAVSELVSYGTAAVGEVTNSLAAVRGLAVRGVVGCIFHEVFGVEREPLEKRVRELPRWVEEHAMPWPSGELSYAPSPHTLYTTHPVVVSRLVREAADRGVRASIHLAEHAAERRYLERGDGPVLAWYETRLKLPPSALAWPGKPPVAFADDLGVLAPHVVCVHLTDARPEELATVAERGAPVVLCPRSNLYIETRLPPLLSMIAAGIAPALGTDSLASSASLDVLAEARALADRFPTVAARELVRMATWNGALALGRSDVGRIARGARPGILAIEGEVGDDSCAFVLRNVKAPRRWLVGPGDGTSPARPERGRNLEEKPS